MSHKATTNVYTFFLYAQEIVELNAKLKQMCPSPCGSLTSSQESFPVRNDLSDLSDDDFIPAKMPEPMKPTVLSFKTKNENDLFGLGIEEQMAQNKNSSDEQDGKSCFSFTPIVVHVQMSHFWSFLIIYTHQILPSDIWIISCSERKQAFLQREEEKEEEKQRGSEQHSHNKSISTKSCILHYISSHWCQALLCSQCVHATYVPVKDFKRWSACISGGGEIQQEEAQAQEGKERRNRNSG